MEVVRRKPLGHTVPILDTGLGHFTFLSTSHGASWVKTSRWGLRVGGGALVSLGEQARSSIRHLHNAPLLQCLKFQLTGSQLSHLPMYVALNLGRHVPYLHICRDLCDNVSLARDCLFLASFCDVKCKGTRVCLTFFPSWSWSIL